MNRRGDAASPPLLSQQIESLVPEAIDVLRRCCAPCGLKGSAGSPGHNQIWARDSMISLLGARLVEDAAIHAALEASLATLRRHQTPAGAIPNHVDAVTGAPNFRAYADAGLWYVIGSALLRPDSDSIQQVLRWYACQDVDSADLISIQEASDWEDLLCVRGKGLYVNCLYVLALRRAAALAETQGQTDEALLYCDRAESVSSAINQVLWYGGDGQMLRHIAASFSTPNPEHDSLGRPRWMPQKRLLVDSHYYLPYVSFREPGEWFDSFGNLLAILTGVADAAQTAHILDLIRHNRVASPPIRAIHPPIERGTPDWREYYGTTNLPHCHHNGGIWPFLGGFYVAALVKAQRYDEAESALEALAALNRSGGFCEWHHGQTAGPLGVRGQAWSAGMFLFARECVASRTVLL